jgi:uncharacterized protein YidB (DUF937 family)
MDEPVTRAVEALLEKHGGLAGIVEHLAKQGLGKTAQSWVGKRANLPICGDQVVQAFGVGTILTLAAEIGVAPQDLALKLAHALPETINRLTPDGLGRGSKMA